MSGIIRTHITFYGRVQGVGFRWHARHAASLHDCTGWCRNEWDGSVVMEIQGTEEAIDSLRHTGWVRNEYDGSVTMEIQGEEAAIDMLLQNLGSDRYIDIRHMDIRTIPVEEGERSFRVKHDY